MRRCKTGSWKEVVGMVVRRQGGIKIDEVGRVSGFISRQEERKVGAGLSGTVLHIKSN